MSVSHSIVAAGLLALMSGVAVGADPAAAEAAAASPGAAPAAAAAPSAPSASAGAGLDNEKDRISYAVGVTTGRALRTADGAEVNLDSLIKGLKDGLEANHLLMPERQMQELLGRFQQTLRQKMLASRGHALAENKVRAEKFLAANKSKEGVLSLSSGVQYRIIKSGKGPLPSESDVVTCNYRGTLLDGREFDATEPGHPAALKVASLIPGWKEAIKLMPVGSHWQLFVPPQLAYAERGVGAEIGPNEALVFDVELLDTQLSKD